VSLPELHGHREAIEGLWRAASVDRLPHAFLFQGPSGVGKFLAARHFALGLFCKESSASRREGVIAAPCNECGPCKRFLSGNHPDLFVIDAVASAQNQITIHFISHRDERPKDAYQGVALEEFLLLKAYEGTYRVVLVREAERMNEAAQNALLKVLEEPAPDTILVLETSAPARLLQTVRSRVIPVEFQPLSQEQTRAILAPHTEGDVDLLVELSDGSPGRALELSARAAPQMRQLLRDVLHGERSERDAADRLWELEGDFPGKTVRAGARLRAATFLDLGLDMFLSAEREAASGAAPSGRCEARRRWRLDRWMQARQDIDLNMSPEAAVERALHALHPAAAFERDK
jgi:DNA polymerase-3 subunit delta'